MKYETYYELREQRAHSHKTRCSTVNESPSEVLSLLCHANVFLQMSKWETITVQIGLLSVFLVIGFLLFAYMFDSLLVAMVTDLCFTPDCSWVACCLVSFFCSPVFIVLCLYPWCFESLKLLEYFVIFDCHETPYCCD